MGRLYGWTIICLVPGGKITPFGNVFDCNNSRKDIRGLGGGGDGGGESPDPFMPTF